MCLPIITGEKEREGGERERKRDIYGLEKGEGDKDETRDGDGTKRNTCRVGK